jgi:iron complex transport system permease protein
MDGAGRRPADTVRPRAFLVPLVLAVLALAGLGLLVGAAGLGVPEAAILWELRAPRVVLAALVGGALGLSGAVLQGALRNPLADPALLGIGGAAGVGAVAAFYWGLGMAAVPLAGLMGAGLGCALLFALAGRTLSATALVLAGVAIAAIASALQVLALSLAPNPYALAEAIFWLMGGLADRAPAHVLMAAPPILLGGALLLRLGRRLDALALGEEVAASLGVPVARTLALAAGGVALAVGAATAVGGGIGFVGLVVPHLLRPALGERPSALLGASALGGAALLLAADLVARAAPLMLPLSQEPPLGVLTALLGAPFLVRIARRVAA